jgi:hypothetical protein
VAGGVLDAKGVKSPLDLGFDQRRVIEQAQHL